MILTVETAQAMEVLSGATHLLDSAAKPAAAIEGAHLVARHAAVAAQEQLQASRHGLSEPSLVGIVGICIVLSCASLFGLWLCLQRSDESTSRIERLTSASSIPGSGKKSRSSRSLGNSSSLWLWSPYSEEDLSVGSGASARARPSVPRSARSQTQLPLCPLLVVPGGTRLNCLVQNDVCRRRQDLTFNVRGAAGASLFQVRVSELEAAAPGIYVETLGGGAQLAFLSTSALWRDGADDSNAQVRLDINWPSGLRFGSIYKTTQQDYAVEPEGGGGPLLFFKGNFENHRIEAKSADGAVVATTTQDDPSEYQVMVHTRNDAGLAILCLLAIDKCEVRVPLSARSSSTSCCQESEAGGSRASRSTSNTPISER